MALDSVLTWDRLVIYPAFALAFFGAAVTWLVAFRGARPLPDFAARWTAGYMLANGRVGDLYDPAIQLDVQTAHIPGSELSLFVSPPIAAAFFAPFAALPYSVACAIWASTSLVSLLVAIKILQSMARADSAMSKGRALLPVLASYPILELLGGGQDSALILLAIVGGIWLLKAQRDVVAGALMALGLLKPHLILIVPFVLLVRGRRRAFLSFALTSVLLALACIAVAGWEGCVRWISLVTGSGYGELVQRGQAWKAASLPALSQALIPPGSSRAWDLIALLLAAAILVVGVIVLARNRRECEPMAVWGFALATTCLASPHLMVYDLVLIIPALFFMTEFDWDPEARAGLLVYSMLLFLVAPLHLVIMGSEWPALSLGSPWHVLVLFWLWNRLRRRIGSPAIAG